MGCCENRGIDHSILFFFLILILLFCNPSIFGCGCEEESIENNSNRRCNC